MSVSVNFIDLTAAQHVPFTEPDISFLMVSLTETEFQTTSDGLSVPVSANVPPRPKRIPIFFRTHVLQNAAVCEQSLRNSFSQLDLPLLADYCTPELAPRMSNIFHEASLRRNDPTGDNASNNGHFFMANFEIIIVDPHDGEFLGDQETYHDFLGDQETEDGQAAISDDVTQSLGEDEEEAEFDDDDVRAALGTSQSRTGSAPAAPRLRPVDKLLMTEHELVDTGDGNVRDQVADEGCCSICLEDFSSAADMILVRFGCKHLFHAHCTLGWLHHNNSCPLCRRQLYELS